MNGILILDRELKVLHKLGHNATVENYKPDRVEREIVDCCKQHPVCRDLEVCKELFDLWSIRAPIEYSPMEFERTLKDKPTLDWMPILILGICKDSWELPT